MPAGLWLPARATLRISAAFHPSSTLAHFGSLGLTWGTFLLLFLSFARRDLMSPRVCAWYTLVCVVGGVWPSFDVEGPGVDAFVIVRLAAPRDWPALVLRRC